MQYNFQSQFAESVANGTKRQTIRALGKRRPPMVGELLQLYTGLRTKQARKLVEPDPICSAVISIEIKQGAVWLAGRKLKHIEVFRIARLDGFNNIAEFMQFFEQTHGDSFEGVLIQWRLSDATA